MVMNILGMIKKASAKAKKKKTITKVMKILPFLTTRNLNYNQKIER